jgi:hypothetical protein
LDSLVEVGGALLMIAFIFSCLSLSVWSMDIVAAPSLL